MRQQAVNSIILAGLAASLVGVLVSWPMVTVLYSLVFIGLFLYSSGGGRQTASARVRVKRIDQPRRRF